MLLRNLAFWRTDEEKFADLVRRGLIAAGECRTVLFDKSAFALRLETSEKEERPEVVYLQNVFTTYIRLPKEKQAQELEHIIASFAEGREPMPRSFASVADRLLPQVRPMTEFGIWRLLGQLEGSRLEEMPFRQLTSAVATWLVYDGDHNTRRITTPQLARWDVNFDDAFDVALANLRRRSEKAFVAVAPGLYCSDWADTCDTSRVLLTDIVAALPVRGAPVAMMPNRDVLLVAGAQDQEGLRSMVRSARKVLADPRPLGANALLLEASVWHDYVPNTAEQSGIELMELQEEQASMHYADQKDLLDKVHEMTGEDIFVASHKIRRESPSGHFIDSIATWTEGVDTLLPKARSVILLQPKNQQMIIGPWDTVAAVAGELLAPMGWWPERFRVLRHPTEAQIEKLIAMPGVEVRPLSVKGPVA
jgi:hypothetical protein